MRVTTDLWVSALLRRVQGAAGFAALLRRGFADAGAVFIVVQNGMGETILFGPAPQTSYGDRADEDRRFIEILRTADDGEISARLERETRFDPDAWIVELEIGREDPAGFFPIANA
jgi:hypothetical protein